MIPVWLNPDLAAGIIRHYGRDGQAIVHPHPESGYNPGLATGGVTPTMPAQGSPRQGAAPVAVPPAPAAGARVAAAGRMAGIPPSAGAAGPAGRSVFAGGPIGGAGPTQRPPVFQAKKGRVMDGRGGKGKVPGRPVPASQKQGHDTVHAMLDPGEAVFNKKQLAGIKAKPGKEHLLRNDQKKAMRKASANAGGE